MAKVANVEAKGCCGVVFPGSWHSPGLWLRAPGRELWCPAVEKQLRRQAEQEGRGWGSQLTGPLSHDPM